jgi:hypothetical protein
VNRSVLWEYSGWGRKDADVVSSEASLFAGIDWIRNISFLTFHFRYQFSEKVGNQIMQRVLLINPFVYDNAVLPKLLIKGWIIMH